MFGVFAFISIKQLQFSIVDSIEEKSALPKETQSSSEYALTNLRCLLSLLKSLFRIAVFCLHK